MAMRTLFFLWLFVGVLSAHEFPENFTINLKKHQILPTNNVIIVKVKEQKLELYRQGKKVKVYTISTGKKGVGQKEGSSQTPKGLHCIAKKIGDKAPSYAIFEARKFTGKLWRHQKKYEKEDLVLTRILWLNGLEEGFNKGVDETGDVVDSHDRYIYIHATNHEDLLGSPKSKGCVRMSTVGVIDLFNIVNEGDIVWIDYTQTP